MAYLEACSVDTAADHEYGHDSQKDPKLHQLHFIAPGSVVRDLAVYILYIMYGLGRAIRRF